MNFTAHAHSFVGTTRLTKTIVAVNRDEAIRIAAQQLEGSGYYLVGVC